MRELRRWLQASPGLALSTGLQLVLAALALLAMPFDHRLILGINPWIKPLKFDVSTVLFMVTMAAVLYGLTGHERTRRWIGWGIGAAMAVENLIISLQSLRGVRSHMNYTSVADAQLFGAMGIFIAFNTILVAWTFALYLRQPTRWSRPLAWGFRLGLLALLAGSIEGVLIVTHGSHTVGAADGLRGLPLVDWSCEHGDLRVPHFFALHALQAMPLLGWGLGRLRLKVSAQLLALGVGFLLYMGGVGMMFHQAMAGQPLL